MRGYTPIPHHLFPNLMKTVYSYFLFAALGLATLSCGDKKGDTPAPSKTDLLTDKNWVATAITVSPGFPLGGTLVTDFYAQAPSCSKDDFIRFEKPAVYKDDEGAVRCTTTDPQTTIGTWAFNGDQTVITVTPQGSTAQSYNVVELTDSSLKYSVGTVISGITYILTITCRKG